MGIELFERAAEARGRLLRVDALCATGHELASPLRAAGYLITFDVGRIFVGADSARGSLSIRQVQSPGELAGELVGLAEEEPWWRVAGNSITRVWPGVEGDGASAAPEQAHDVRIQFREDQENPKVISLRYDAGEVRVAEEERRSG